MSWNTVGCIDVYTSISYMERIVFCFRLMCILID